VIKISKPHRSLSQANPTKEPLTQSLLTWAKNVSTVENTDQRSAKEIHATDVSKFNSDANVTMGRPSNIVSYQNRVPF
jgi:hypothetical protein